MGYQTYYRLTFDQDITETVPCPTCQGKGEIILKNKVADFLAHTKFAYQRTETLEDTAGESAESHKWYEHEQEMKELSLIFPDTLFTLKGEGEETGDIWVKYFKNGKMQSSKAEIVLEPFNEEKLA